MVKLAFYEVKCASNLIDRTWFYLVCILPSCQSVIVVGVDSNCLVDGFYILYLALNVIAIGGLPVVC